MNTISQGDRYDVVLYGATSFVGALIAEHLARSPQEGRPFTWALAGRARPKLEALRAALAAAPHPPTAALVADAHDPEALRALCGRARVVLSTVGPYAQHGEGLVRACAELGVDYCDLTGEVHWVRRMIERHEAAAAASGARLVMCCGFDSLPSDLGVDALQREAQRRFGAPLGAIRYTLDAARGGFSGGTVASLTGALVELAGDPAQRRLMASPYALCVGSRSSPAPATRQPAVRRPARDPRDGAWLAPFLMADINTRVVHRTHALRAHPYGASFTYSEATRAGRGAGGWLIAQALTLGLGALGAALLWAPTRRALTRWALPRPGEGPSAREREAGFFVVSLWGEAPSGERLGLRVQGDRDPGYGATAQMCAEAALCLAFDVGGTSEAPGGFWTPAALMGEALVGRLGARTGVRFEVVGG